MMPAYRSMDSHPSQRDQMAFPHYCQPGLEGIPPQMNVDPSKSPFAYEQPWPYAGSYGYPTPMQFCRGHYKLPGYCTYRSAYPHIPAPSPMYFSGGCPAYVEPFYVPYALPPHYAMELPRYEYDKCMPREYHCCGCPNYLLSHREDKSVRIEEHEPENKMNNAMVPIQLKNYPYPFVWIPPEYAGKRELIKPVAAEVGEPDVDKKVNNAMAPVQANESDVKKKVNNAIAPVQVKNHPYPFVWIPPEYMGNRELRKPVAAEVGDQDRISHDRKPPEYASADGQEPKVWNGWFPLDINSLSNMVQNGDGRKNKNAQIDNSKKESEDGRTNHSQQSEGCRREFPFPIIWMPNSNMQERTNNQESTYTTKSIQEVPHESTSVPVNSCTGNDVSNRTNVNGNDSNIGGSDVEREVISEKIIPVKQMELQKSDSEGTERRVRNIPVKQAEENMTDKEFQTSIKRQSNSPRKTSKLPPVCLRLDPLPRKKNGNGISRSPCPPASKEHSQATADVTSKASTSSSTLDKAQVDVKLQDASKEKSIKMVEKCFEQKDKEQRDGSQSHDKAQADSKLHNASNLKEEVKPKDKSTKVLEKSSEKKEEDQRDGSESQITSNMASGVRESSSALTGTKESWTNGEEYKIKENEAERKVDSVIKEETTEAREAKDSTKRTDNECRKERKVLSDAGAAVLIQAAYRGFQVRKWEPLKKLKQIAEVSRHVTDVRASIQALETSSDFQNDGRERVAIGETIMRLLLKLDTIQGLHPSFREMRKALARELTSLQEKLDSIRAKKSQQQMEDLSAKKPVEDTSLAAPNGEYMQEQPEKRLSVPGKDSSEGIIRESHDTLEQQPEEKVAVPAKDSSDSIIYVSRDMIEQCQDQLSMKDGNRSHEDEKLQCKSSSPNGLLFKEETEPLSKGMVKEDVSHVSIVEASESGIFDIQNKTKPESEDVPVDFDDLDMKAWKELPQGVIDERELADTDFRNDKKNEIEGEELQVSGVTTKPGDTHFPAMMDDFAQDGASSQIHEVAELPVGLLDDDTATSEFEKHNEAGFSEQVLQTGEMECNAALETNSLADDISKETQLDQQQQLQQAKEQEEVYSTDESDGWVKIESQKDELKGDGSLDAELESRSRKENDQQFVTKESTGNDRHETADEDASLEVKEVPVAVTPEEEVGKGEAPEEEVALEEAQSERGDMVGEQGINADAENREALAEQMGEQAVASPVSKEPPIPEHDEEMDTDKNLVEENEKLRKMMQKLLEAGNEQLTIISNLTGRVKDLEKKLARKKVRTRHCRPATSKPSFKKLTNNPLQGRAVGVAM